MNERVKELESGVGSRSRSKYRNRRGSRDGEFL